MSFKVEGRAFDETWVMPAFGNLLHGYDLPLLALALVTAYFALATLVVNLPGPPRVSVPRYAPPASASPAVASWLLERDLPRAVAAALIDMAAKGYLRIEQNQGLCTVTQLRAKSRIRLEPEEDALSWRLFRGYDTFDFDELTARLIVAVQAFQTALQDTTYVSSNTYISIPAWIVSGFAIMIALANTPILLNINMNSARVLALVAVATFLSFIVAVRTLPSTFEKIFTRLPGSTAPQRPWTGADTRPFKYLSVTFIGICLLGALSSTPAALITLGFLVVNGVFYHCLQGLTPAGRQALGQISDYREFLSAVDSDAISRRHVADRVPDQLGVEDAYAVAFHLDLGWGEQFVTSIADLVELAAASNVKFLMAVAKVKSLFDY